MGTDWLKDHLLDFCIKKMFENGAIRLDLPGLSWIKLDFCPV
jgi:hypothetical protein